MITCLILEVLQGCPGGSVSQHHFKLHACVGAEDLIQVNARFCSSFSFLCAAGCTLTTEFYANQNNTVFHFPAIFKSVAV